MYISLSLKEIIGVDEAGRGPLAGQVVAAAVILDAPINQLTDSKKCSEKKETIYLKLFKSAQFVFHLGKQVLLKSMI